MTYLRFFWLVLVIIFISSASLSAARDPMQPRELSPRQQAIAERRQQFEQDAAAAGPLIDSEFAKFVNYVNSGRTPDDPNIRTSAKFITRNKRFLPILTKQNNAGTYHALCSWVYYFDGKQDKAQKQIALGIKDSTYNSNFINTAVALSMVYQDYNSVTQILEQIASDDSPSEESSALQETLMYSQSQEQGTLNLDVNSVRSDLLGKNFNLGSLSETADITCVLLWQVDSEQLDLFAPPPPPPAVDQNTIDPNNPPPPPEPAFEQQQVNYDSISSQPIPELVAFTNLQNRFSKNQKAAFIGINFNDPSKSKHLENWITKNPQKWNIVPPLPMVQQAVSSALGGEPEKPVLLIAGPDSKIRYAGDVNSFLPNMIIKNILENPQPTGDSNEPNVPADSAITEQQIEVLEPAANENSDEQQIAPAAQPQSQSAEKTIQTQSDDQNKSNDEFNPRAETLLENAKAFFKIGNRMQYHTYAKPIEMCRTVIRDYPNTKYADEARVLMRQVPERFRQRYKITDEELGL